ncbi:hypothetical protein L2E82_17016 [Cichorium intybus]|uniref:Uncharacterized protein n=1 Tax=Cichorium intybus TaxID=13427 RepID=A0ACB9F742_CICIN|nr:hypothetical protein L2E82_17016 [Cichorium intybus]
MIGDACVDYWRYHIGCNNDGCNTECVKARLDGHGECNPINNSSALRRYNNLLLLFRKKLCNDDYCLICFTSSLNSNEYTTSLLEVFVGKKLTSPWERKLSVLAGYCIVFMLHVIGVYWWYQNDDLCYPLLGMNIRFSSPFSPPPPSIFPSKFESFEPPSSPSINSDNLLPEILPLDLLLVFEEAQL